jgi:hypothetical protein
MPVQPIDAAAQHDAIGQHHLAVHFGVERAPVIPFTLQHLLTSPAQSQFHARHPCGSQQREVGGLTVQQLKREPVKLLQRTMAGAHPTFQYLVGKIAAHCCCRILIQWI